MKGCVIMPLPREQTYTVEDIYNLPEGERAELIDGQIYYLYPDGHKAVDEWISGFYVDSNGVWKRP